MFRHFQSVTLYWDASTTEKSDCDSHSTSTGLQYSSFKEDELGSIVVIDWLGAGRLGRQELWDFQHYDSVNQIMIDIRIPGERQKRTNELESRPTCGHSTSSGCKNRKSDCQSTREVNGSTLEASSSVTFICRDGVRLYNELDQCKLRVKNQMSPYTCIGVCLIMGPKVASLTQQLEDEFNTRRREAFHRCPLWRNQRRNNGDATPVAIDRYWMQPMIITACPMERQFCHPRTSKMWLLPASFFFCVPTVVRFREEKITQGDHDEVRSSFDIAGKSYEKWSALFPTMSVVRLI